jgi:thiamine biosynthesis protein ThiS
MTEAPLIHLNDQALPWQPQQTVAQLLSAQALDPLAVATALNGQFVSRDARHTTWLQPGDQLSVLRAITGG